MDPNTPRYPKTSFWQKSALVMLGVFLTFIVLETGLRLGGFIILSLQEFRNRASLVKKSEYRILCLGESTTQGQYPLFLEEALNQRNIGIKFSVIDKGVIGTNTWIILSSLESNLDTYHPDMVITMMGINDDGPHLSYEPVSDSKGINFLKSFRTYKLARLLWLHMKNRLQEVTFYKLSPNAAPLKLPLRSNEALKYNQTIELNSSNDEAYVELGRGYQKQGRLSESVELFKKAIELNSSNDKAYVGLGGCYRDQGKLSEAEESFKKAIELNPRNDGVYVELGRCYRKQGKFSEPVELFKKAIELNPSNDEACVELGRWYQKQGRLSEAGESFKKAVELNPRNDEACVELGRCYRKQGKFSESAELFKKAIELSPSNDEAYVGLGWGCRDQGLLPESVELFKKAIELNPSNDKAYVGLGWVYQAQRKSFESEESFKKALELNPSNDEAYVELGGCYRKQGKLSEAAELFKKAIENNPENDKAYRALEVLYIEMGNTSLARKYGKEARDLRLNDYPLVTTSNYLKLKAILDKRGITYVCAQYPMRSLKPLKKALQGDDKGIVFVDNEKVFKDAVAKDGYISYFRDMFGGDFGHCTNKGNRLLAENITNAILKNIFGK